MLDQAELINKTKEMRQLALTMGLQAKGKGAHFGAAMSSMEIFSCLYGAALRPEKDDVLVLGKGHCVLALYAALAAFQIIPLSELSTFDQDGSKLMGHPVMNDEWGITFSGGSLGMALSQGVGLALSRKIKNKTSKIYVILGDGECQEGAIWEAAMSASHFNLNNLVVIIDCNHLQYDGETNQVMSLGDFADKWKSFGFHVSEVDGNDVTSLLPELTKNYDSPSCIIANTIKGKGISFMEGKKEWHHKMLSQNDYNLAMEELG